jgi:hypothetical protein
MVNGVMNFCQQKNVRKTLGISGVATEPGLGFYTLEYGIVGPRIAFLPPGVGAIFGPPFLA